MKKRILFFIAGLIILLSVLATLLHFHQRNSDFGPGGGVVASIKSFFSPKKEVLEKKRLAQESKRKSRVASARKEKADARKIESRKAKTRKIEARKAETKKAESKQESRTKFKQSESKQTSMSWWQRLKKVMQPAKKESKSSRHTKTVSQDAGRQSEQLLKKDAASSARVHARAEHRRSVTDLAKKKTSKSSRSVAATSAEKTSPNRGQLTASIIRHSVVPANAIPVVLARVKHMDVAYHIDSVGVLRAKQQIVVSSEIAGKISAILFKSGSFVKRGTPLFTLDDRVYQANLKSARSALVLSQSNYSRYQRIANTGAVSKQELAQAKATFEEDQAKVSANEAYLAQTTLVAPFSGYVSNSEVSMGDFVNPGDKLTTLVDRELLLASYLIPERYIMQLAVGQTVYVEPENAAGQLKSYQGKVSYIAPSIDEVTHSVSLQAEVPNLDNQLTPGSFIRVKQIVKDNQKAIVIPEDAVMQTIEGAQVFRVVNGYAHRVDVELGEESGEYVQVVDGLSLGDEVVVAGQQSLISGNRVRQVGAP